MIGFTGPYSDVNFGDYAMLVNNVYALDAKEVMLFVYDRGFMEIIQNHYFAGRNIELVEVVVRPGAFADGRGTGFLTPLDVLWQIGNIDEIKEAVSKMDTLYVNGGGYLNSLWSQPHRVERLVQIIAPALVAATMNIPVVFTANGYGPFRGDLEFFAAFFGSLPNARFGVRDNILSPHWLMQTGVDPSRITHLPDDLLFIDERLVANAKAQRTGYIVMETYLPTDFIAENFEHFERFVQRMVSEHNVRVVFLPFNVAHGGMDQGRFLEMRLKNVELFDIAGRGYLPIEDAVSLVRDAELVISSRYHAVILALSLGTPIVSVLKDVLGDKQYYYAKNVGALEGVLEGEPHDLRDYFFNDYVDALDRVAQDFDGIVLRQRKAHTSAYPRTSKKLRAARDSYIGEGV